MYFFREKKKNTLRYHFFTTVYQKSWWYDLQLVRYRVWQQIEIGNYGSLLTLLPPSPLFQKPKETRILKKCKKLPEASSFYTYVLKTTIQWGMVPEIRSETDRIFFAILAHFMHFYPNNPKIKILKKIKKHLERASFYICVPKIMIMMYCFWDIRHNKQFFVILDHILPFDLTINPKNQNFKMPRDIVILHLSTINDNHMMYGFWDVEHNRQIFFVILDYFLHL